MSPRTGRPKIDNPKNVRLEIRLTKQQDEQLCMLAEKMKISRTDVVLKGIELLEQSTK